MSCEQDMTFAENTGDGGLFLDTPFFQNNEPFADMKCFGFVRQTIPEYLLSWGWSASSPGAFPINYESFPLPIPASEPCNYGQQTYNLLEGETSDSPLSLTLESGPSFEFTEASPYSEAFGFGIRSSLDNSQPSDSMQSPLGPGTSQQTIYTAEAITQPKSSRDNQDRSERSTVSNTSISEVRRLKKNPPKGRRRGKNSERNQLFPVAKFHHQVKRTKLSNDKKGKKRTKLEQNRLAAAKCRDRKRDLANVLNNEMEVLKDRHDQLSSYYNQLRSEVVRLKTEVLRHGDCDCDFIQRYILAAANTTVAELTKQHPSPNGCDKGLKQT
ncbi:hypothetical protein FAVG1_06772 [Fusarium avenaceum]|nr:hypothetical protein FAVG1_06772 [Fusarium avenaceum]